MNEECRMLREKLLDWADGRASAEDAARVEGHVDACAACRALAEPLRRAAPPAMRVEVPDAMLAAMKSGLDRRLDALEPEPAPGWLAWLFAGNLAVPKPLAWGAVAALVLVSSGRAPERVERPAVVLMEGVDLVGRVEAGGG